MDRSYRNRLLREAVKDPRRLATREKFWKLELWPHYLRRCDDGLGECLLCRGHAYCEFGQPGKGLEDLSAALNHVSLRTDPKPYYAALHNLVDWAARYGTDEELHVAYDNLKPALLILNTIWGKPYPKLKLRWLIAMVEARLGHFGRAEEVYLEVRKGLVKLVETKAHEALDIWRHAEIVNEDILKNARKIFFNNADPMPNIAA